MRARAKVVTVSRSSPLVPLFLAVHLVGALVGAAEFAESTIFCRWRFVLGAPGWSVISGDAEGQTQAADVEVRRRRRPRPDARARRAREPSRPAVLS